jgi:hypothetical protein
MYMKCIPNFHLTTLTREKATLTSLFCALCSKEIFFFTDRVASVWSSLPEAMVMVECGISLKNHAVKYGLIWSAKSSEKRQ